MRRSSPVSGSPTSGPCSSCISSCRASSRRLPRVGDKISLSPVKIADIRSTPVSVPLVAPLRHANGCHWGRFVRTIVEVETDDGRIGLGELGGGGEAASAAVLGLKPYLVGRDPARLEEMRFLIANPTASLYNLRTQMLAALEFACLDLLGQEWGVPVSDILGGRLRDQVPFASYLFFRYANASDGSGEVRTVDHLVAEARALKQQCGFTTHKLKGGVFPPRYELDCYRALAAALPDDGFRFDPNGVWSTEVAVWFGRQIESLDNDYLEDPVFGLHGMRRARERIRIPLATMLHLGAVIPNLTFAADAHYHHLLDDIVEGGKVQYCHGAIPVPTSPGLGVKLDRDRLAQYHESFLRLGPYPYDQDPLRPGWAPLIPNTRWADPADGRVPHVPA